MSKKTSIYRGVYYSRSMSRWVVELENHHRFPCFLNERAAAVYSEYHLRKRDHERYHFKDMDDDEISDEYRRVMENRDIENAWIRSHSKQGRKRAKPTSSKYVGVLLKEGTRWVARIQFKGKMRYIASFSISKYEDAEVLAARAYDRKALELYGDGARLNFPIENYR